MRAPRQHDGRRHAPGTTTRRRRVRPFVAAAVLAGFLAPAAIGSAHAAPSPSLTRYPYLTDSIQSSITVNWATDRSASTGSVTWGPVGSCAAHTLAATKTAITVISSAQYQWKATIPVSPDQQYCYRVVLGSVDLLGGDASPTFTSQAAVGSTAPFSFAVFGDWGQAYAGGVNADQSHVLAQMARSGSRFAVMTGDTAYPGGGQSEYGDLYQAGTDISTVFGPSFWAVPGRSLPVFNVTGNHGFTNGAVQVVNWPEGNAAATSGGRYLMEPYPSINGSTAKSYPSMWYAFDAGGARFYALTVAWADGNVGTASVYQQDRDAHWTVASAEYQWLKADLAAHPGSVKFAFWHYPLYADSSGQPSDSYLQGGAGTLQGLLDQYGVDIAFNGHAHGYQRNRPDSAGLISYVVGNGGAALGRIGTCSAFDLYAVGAGGSHCGAAPGTFTNSQVYGFLRVTVDGRIVTVAPTNSLGQTFDVQTYDFSVPGGDAQAPSVPALTAATAVSPTRVDVSWAPSTDNIGVVGYRLYRNGSATPLASTSSTSFSDTTVAAATTYSYQVSAFDATGNESARSTPLSATTPSATSTTYSFTATGDATVDASNPTINYGTGTRVTTDNSPVNHALLAFSVSGLPACTVTRATLRLTVGSTVNDNSVYGGDVYAASSTAWSQSSVTWATAPTAVGAKVSSVATAVALGTSYAWDVTPLVAGNGSVGLVLSSTSGDGARYYSTEGGTAAQAPRLDIVC